MRTIIALLVAAAAPASAQVAPFEDLNALDTRIALALGGTVADAGVLARPVDRRLRLIRCPGAVTIDAPIAGAVAVRCAQLGWRLRVPTQAVQRPDGEMLVRRGESVELTYAGSGFDVTTSATAAEDGRMGSAIRVKTSTGGGGLTARVSGPGTVIAGY
jgi:flagellar basal body P-ring formation protein FlgA